MSQRDRTIARRLVSWFRAHKRAFPWRPTDGDARNPYHALVSEAMLQQTQASRVAERFPEFLERFPTIHALAEAEEQAVLAAWSGLGYYRRARNLYLAAQVVVESHAGVVPRDIVVLQSLPGVGRYTAGAIASIVFGERTPLVDANVVRVVLRLEGRELPASSSAAHTLAWERAESLVHAADDPAAFNEGLMELGAIVCRPRAPQCAKCPLARQCVARREGRQASIPTPKPKAARRRVTHACLILRDDRGRMLVERRPDGGLWAGLWQAPTVEREDAPIGGVATAAFCDHLGAIAIEGLHEADGSFTFATTHRLVAFHLWRTTGPIAAGAIPRRRGRRWATRAEIERLPLSTPQRRILLGAEGENAGRGRGR